MARITSNPAARRAALLAACIVVVALICNSLMQKTLAPVLATALAIGVAMLVVFGVDRLVAWQRGKHHRS